MAKKPVLTAKEAAAMIPDGATIMCGGFLACGQARAIVKELGFDAGFGAGKYADDVASFAGTEMVKRGMK